MSSISAKGATLLLVSVYAMKEGQLCCVANPLQNAAVGMLASMSQSLTNLYSPAVWMTVRTLDPPHSSVLIVDFFKCFNYELLFAPAIPSCDDVT